MQISEPARPRLSVNILTRQSERRIERLVAEVACFADEILIGVDASSPDRTYDVACGLADVVYRFRLPGQLSPARMLVFEHATGDWILSLDDDESMEESFDGILPALLSDASITHVWFPRKWIVSVDPCEYLHASPWYPNFALRLFRNDRSLVWKPQYVHSQYYVQGTGYFEERTSILHFELVYNTDKTRAHKLDMYRQSDGPSTVEYYSPPRDTPRRPAVPRRPAARKARDAKAILHPAIRNLKPIGLPPWKAEFLKIDVPARARADQPLIAEITVMNSGVLAWSRRNSTNNNWPILCLGNHLLDANGRLLELDRDRVELPRFARPGDQVTFICSLRAPSSPGAYILEWDMVSEFECWFAECGSFVGRTYRDGVL
jgi:glycosyltransferase involved in cell wall biosynthesis